MKNPILLFVVAYITFSTISAMEPAEKIKPGKIRKVYSASLLGGGITSSHEYFDKMNRESITKLRNRFCALSYAISYKYSPLVIMNQKRSIDCNLKANDLLDEIDRFAHYRKRLYQTYCWTEQAGSKKTLPSDLFFNMEEGVLPDELAQRILALEAESGELTPKEIEFLQQEEEKLKKECARIFVQKKIFPADTKFRTITNIHGDIKGLMKVLEQFEKDGIINNDLKVLNGNAVFCVGNCGDEGLYSLEVWYALLAIANENPDKFFIIRGPHEHIMENSAWIYDEAKIKFDREEERKKKESMRKEIITRDIAIKKNPKKKISQTILERMNSLYRLLPVAMFVGIKNIGKNHTEFTCVSRGLELGYQGSCQLLGDNSDQACQWLTHINRSKQIRQLPERIMEDIKTIVQDGNHANLVKELSHEENVPVVDIKNNKLNEAIYNLGFCHDDFQVEENAKVGYDEKFKVWQWSKDLTQAVLNLWSNNHKSWYRSMIMWLNYPLRKLFGWGFNNNPTYSVSLHCGAYQGKHGTCPPLMRKIINNNGAYNMWDKMQKPNEIITLAPGSAVTVLGFPDNQHGYLSIAVRNRKKVRNKLDGYSYFMPFNFATIATLTFNAAKAAWQMTHRNVKVIDTTDKKFLGIRPSDDVVGIEAMD